MPLSTVPASTVDASTIDDAADVLAELLDYANDSYVTFTSLIGRPTLENVNQLTVRLSNLKTAGPACTKEIRAVFEVSVVICIDDDPRKGTATAGASGPVIAQTMWRIYAGLQHIVNTYQKSLPPGVAFPRCNDTDIGDMTISYEAGRALGRFSVEFPVPTVASAITGS